MLLPVLVITLGAYLLYRGIESERKLNQDLEDLRKLLIVIKIIKDD